VNIECDNTVSVFV